MSNGSTKEIEKINPGDKILGDRGETWVMTNYIRTTTRMMEVQFNNNFTIQVSLKQNFKLTDGSITAARYLQVGDVVQGYKNTFFVSNLVKIIYKVKRAGYMLSLGKPSMWYYVGDGVMVAGKL